MSIRNISRKHCFAADLETAAPLLGNTDGHTDDRKITEYSQQMAFLHTWEIRASTEADHDQLSYVRVHVWSWWTDSHGISTVCLQHPSCKPLPDKCA